MRSWSRAAIWESRRLPKQVPVLQREIIARCRASGHAGHRGDPDARVDDRLTAADAGGGFRCGERDLRPRGRGHAVRRDRDRLVSRPSRWRRWCASRSDAEARSSSSASERRAPRTTTPDVPQAVSAAVCELAEDLDVDAIITATQTGATALRCRAPSPERSDRRGHPVRGGRPTALARVGRALGGRAARARRRTTDSSLADQAVRDAGVVRPGERVAITAGVARGVPGGTDLILVRDVPA